MKIIIVGIGKVGYAIAEHFLGKEKVQPLRDGMIYSELA